MSLQQQTKELDSLFNQCLQRSFPNQDLNQVRKSCSRLANLCSYSGTTFVASKHWLSEFKDRQKALSKEEKEQKEQKKKQKKQKKKQKQEAKKQKKAQKKADKKAKKHNKEDKETKKARKTAEKQKKKEEKKQKKSQKEAEKKAKKARKKAEKEAKKNQSPEEKKAEKKQKKQEKKQKKQAKKDKKKHSKKDKKAKKFQKKAGKIGKKLLKEEDKLEKKQRKIAKKLTGILNKSPQLESAKKGAKGGVDIEKRLASVREVLQSRDKSISRYATCLAFVNEDKVKDSVDAQCVALKKASEFAFKAEQCWGRYLDVISQCKAQSKKKDCYKSLGGLDRVCSQLDSQSKDQFNKIFSSKESELK